MISTDRCEYQANWSSTENRRLKFHGSRLAPLYFPLRPQPLDFNRQLEFETGRQIEAGVVPNATFAGTLHRRSSDRGASF